MIFLGLVLVGLGLIACFGVADEIAGLDPTVVGMVLLAGGAAATVVGVVNRARSRHIRSLSAVDDDPASSVVQRWRALPRMVRAVTQGNYPGLPRHRVILWLLGVVYLISPIDLLPELLPVLGVTDDAGLLVLLLTNITRETGRFLGWEREKSVNPE